MKKKRRAKLSNPVAKSVLTGEHGARRSSSTHKSKKKYTRKKKHR
jgi:hypothetical protein